MNDRQAIEAPKIILIVGPTGSGKTAFAINLAQRLNGEIVGADSMQIFRYMNIGTAKPTPAERAACPHHMIDIAEPDQEFDAADYAKMAIGIIRQIRGRGRTVFVVGGTGFYIKSLIYGLFPDDGSDPAVRQRLKQRAKADRRCRALPAISGGRRGGGRKNPPQRHLSNHSGARGLRGHR